MSARVWRLAAAGVLGSCVLLLASCVADGGYVSGDVGYGVDFYEPYGYDYGGWGNGYWVGPGHRGWDHDHPAPPHRGNPGYRAPPAGHSMPSLPRGRAHR